MDIKAKYVTFLAICAQSAAASISVAGREIRVATPLASKAEVAYAEPHIALTALDREVINRVYRFLD